MGARARPACVRTPGRWPRAVARVALHINRAERAGDTLNLTPTSTRRSQPQVNHRGRGEEDGAKLLDKNTGNIFKSLGRKTFHKQVHTQKKKSDHKDTENLTLLKLTAAIHYATVTELNLERGETLLSGLSQIQNTLVCYRLSCIKAETGWWRLWKLRPPTSPQLGA